MSEGISVSELNLLILETLRKEPGLRSVTVTAEVSGFKHYLASGHWYFTLKDATASISAVMFRQNTAHATLKPRDGDRVTVKGYVELYPRDGRIQLYCLSMKPAGTGSLYEQFEALKKKLSAEGLFDPGRKKILPRVPQKVAVITSASGAALHDILNVSGMRSPSVPILVVPSAVQGDGAGKQLTEALRKAQGIPGVDVIIIGRGGGSQEDLWCFNDEGLARAIAACPLPVVSGVGHEVDFTICDFVADVRASTPSNAAEIVFPDRAELKQSTRLYRAALGRAMSEQLHARMLRIHETRERLQRVSPGNRVHGLIDQAHSRRRQLEQAAALLTREKETLLREKRSQLLYRMDREIRSREHQLGQTRIRLEAISPLRVLDRGYALVYGPDGRVIPDAREAGSHPEMSIRFRDGQVDVVRKERA